MFVCLSPDVVARAFIQKYKTSKMKIALLSIAAFVGAVSAAGTQGYKKREMEQLMANSKAARNLMAKAKTVRNLEDNFEEAVIAKYSVVFESCHNATTWSDQGAQTIGLVKFSLCPSDYCTEGCSSSEKGEYVVDLPTFLDAYLEAQADALEYKCEMMREQCGCDGQEDDCLYYCYKDYEEGSWTACLNDGESGDRDRYAECERLEIKQDEQGRRLDQQEEVEYFMAPICGSGGSSILLALYSDDDCAYPVENGASIYYSLAGATHPNFETSLVSTDCVSCLEPQEQDDKNDDDEVDEDEVTRMCEEIYNSAAKCETYMTAKSYPDESGCNYISTLTASRYRRFLDATASVFKKVMGNKD